MEDPASPGASASPTIAAAGVLGLPGEYLRISEILRLETVSGALVLVATAAAPRMGQFSRLDDGLAWIDVAGLTVLAGVGFTVSLLSAELSFGAGSAHVDHAKVAMLTGSLVAALLVTVVLRLRNRHYRSLKEAWQRDADGNGVPDLFERTS